MAEEIGSNKYHDFDMCEDCNWEEQKKELFVLVAERGNSGSGNISKVKEKFAAAILDIDIYSERE